MDSGETYQVGDLTLNVDARLLIRGGVVVTLPPKTFELLVALVRKAPGVVSRRELMDSVWVDEIVNDEALTQRVMLLRRALGDRSKDPLYIASVPRWGYRVVAPVGPAETADELEPEALAEPSPVGERRSSLPRPVAVVAAVGIAVIVAAVALTFIRRIHVARPPDSLAVVPFSVEPSAEPAPHIRSGLPEGLTNLLSRLPGLRVVAWSTMTRFQGPALEPDVIARELRVSSLLVGRVTEDRGMLNVMVELVDARDGSHLWGESYLRPKESLFDLEREIATAVARTLRPRITDAELQRLEHSHTESFEAYESYLKGRYCWNQREPEMIARALEFFKRAIIADPDFAAARVGLADCYVVLGGAPYGVIHPGEAVRLALAEVEEAIRHDPSLAEAHATFAMLAWSHRLDWSLAADEFEVSLRLNPGYATAHQWFAEYLAATGDLEAAEMEIQQALGLDPLSAIIGVDAGLIAYYRRDYLEAVARYRAVLETEPGFSQALLGLGLALGQADREDEAIAILEALVDRSGRAPPAIAALGFVSGRAGRSEQAQALLGELLAASRDRYVPAYYIGGIYIGLGDIDRAFEWMFRAVEEPSSLVASLAVEPGVDSLRRDPRFEDLLRRLGRAG